MGSRRGTVLQDHADGFACETPSFFLLPTEVDLGRGVECPGVVQHGQSVITGVLPTDEGFLHRGKGVGEVQRSVIDGFLNVDLALEKEVLNFAENSTKQKDNWAHKKFDAWRQISGLDCSVPLEKLGLHELNEFLSRFFLVVCKKGGALFPSDTLMGMLRCFGRMLRKEQELRIASNGVCEVPFDIARNPIFKATQNAVLAAMRRSVAQGVCNDRKKMSVIGVSLEEAILRDVDFSVTHARGCQMRFAFFCMLHFCVRGGLELYNLQRSMFSAGNDELGAYLRFCERSSKNYKVDFNHFQPEHFRPAVTVRDSDVLATYEQLMRHMPVVIESEKNLLYMFLQPINSPRTQVWYSRNRVSVKVLTGLVKSIAERSGFAGKFSNKSLRNTCVTRMSLGQVPQEVGMLVTGHKRLSSYEKYDLSNEVRVAAAQEILSQPYDESGKLKAYPQVLEKKFSTFSKNIEGNVHDSDNTGCSGKKDENVTLGVRMEDGRIGTSAPVVGISGNASAGICDRLADGRIGAGAPVVGISGSVGVRGIGGSAPIDGGCVEGTSKSHSPGIVLVPYKIGDEIPFDEELLNHLPAESAHALGVASHSSRSRGASILPSCIMNNCVVNLYVGKENLPCLNGF